MARPQPPANVVASKGNPTVVITWDAVSGASSYTVYRAYAPDTTGGVIGVTGDLTWTDTLAVNDVIYYYSVSDRTADGCSEPSPQDFGYQTAVAIALPDAPIILMVTVIP